MLLNAELDEMLERLGYTYEEYLQLEEDYPKILLD